jgi:hypothetical protein
VDSRNKVVRINSLRPAEKTHGNVVGAQHRENSLLFAHLPPQFVDMKSKSKQGLQPLLQALFDNIDDALFELADRADENAIQNMYFESMREIRIKRRAIEVGFNRELEEAFRRLVGAPGFPPLLSDETDVDVADRLALVDHEELEELVATDAMVAKAVRQFAKPLSKLTSYLDILNDGLTVTNENNPLGPFLICHNFVLVCKDLELDIKAKLVLFKMFDRYVMGGLEAVYVSSNEIIVTGELAAALQRREASLSTDKEPDDAHAESNDSARGKLNSELESSVLPKDEVQKKSGDVFSDLQSLLHELPEQHSSALNGLVASGQGPQIPRERLLGLLQIIQVAASKDTQVFEPTTTELSPQPCNIQQSLGQLLADTMPSMPMSINQLDEDAINLVAMLFQFILDDQNLAAPMRALIARLQLPIVKVSMLDKTFFSKGGHPARKLLNEIANASLGWSVEKNVDRDPLYNEVSDIVNRLLNDAENDVGIFHEVLADFMAFLEIDKRRSKLVQQRTVNAEDGKAKSEVARHSVKQVLADKMKGKSIPKVVIALLEEAWSNVLFLIYLKDGDQHSHWHEALSLVDDLLWSVEPLGGVDCRQRLIKMIPELLHNLRSGLTTVAYNPFDMNQLFADLEKIHLAQLQSINTMNKAPLAATEATQITRIEKTLDQMLEAHVKGHVSLEDLDAELDAQLDAIDELSIEKDQVSKNNAQISSVKVAEQKSISESSDDSSDDTYDESVAQVAVVPSVDEELSADFELHDDDPAMLQSAALSMGSCVEIHQEDGKKYRCRLAAVIRSTGKYIFVNRAGMKVAEHTRMSLAIDIKRGEISVLDEGLLFDRALESVIGNLRDTKRHIA